MKAAILCGGKGGRMQRVDAASPPKPLALIGGRAMLHRIMDYYYSQGISEFVLALGHRAEEILSADGYDSAWSVEFVYTGSPDEVNTGGRLKKLYNQGYLQDTFLLSYCDILTDASIKSLLDFHRQNNSLLTLTATNPILPFGVMDLDRYGRVNDFIEKPRCEFIWANEGIYIVEPEFVEGISELELISFESSVIPAATPFGRVHAFEHRGAWLPVNSYSDLLYINELWDAGKLDWLKEKIRV